MSSDKVIRKIAENAVVAAIYFVLTIATAPFAYGQIQFRVAEMLVLLCFWRPDFVFGVTLGCLIANFNSSLGLWDVLIGSAATLISSLLVAYASPRLWVGIFYPVIANAFVVGWELNWLLELDFWPSVGFVAVGEATVIVLSYVLWIFLVRRPSFMAELRPSRHQDIRY